MKKFNVFYLVNSRMRCKTCTTTSKNEAIKLFWYYVDKCIIGGSVELVECFEVVEYEL